MSNISEDISILLDHPTPKHNLYSTVFIFAHGAGAPMDSLFMNAFSVGLAENGIGVVRFEFPYMAQRRQGGSKRPPNKQEVLIDTWKTLISQLYRDPKFSHVDSFFLGGKSMGGRMATLALNEMLDMNLAIQKKIKGIICLGYPFHPVGKPEKLRTEHLPSLKKTCLVVQGTRDKLGNKAEVESYDLGGKVDVMWLEDGDHDFKPRKKSGFSHEEHLLTAVDLTVNFIDRLK
ncbi:MAG: alpha/beta family hydrolase [Cellvibrionaceae bacterium]